MISRPPIVQRRPAAEQFPLRRRIAPLERGDQGRLADLLARGGQRRCQHARGTLLSVPARTWNVVASPLLTLAISPMNLPVGSFSDTPQLGSARGLVNFTLFRPLRIVSQPGGRADKTCSLYVSGCVTTS